MTLPPLLWLVVGLLALGALGAPLARARVGSAAVYGASLALASAGVALSGSFLLGGAPVERMTLPLGIPWLGAHFRLDALG
ncbi:MAG TPA: hypothetical protein VFQ22_04930, partial [Longimicrobiales bacterium]|nr:hypothetical protein [Longimicrobiales bacterium]